MNIMILGNERTNAETIKALSERLAASGNTVRISSQRTAEIGEDTTLMETFSNIDRSDIVLAVPKDGLIFSQSVTAGIAYTRHCKKAVFIYYG